MSSVFLSYVDSDAQCVHALAKQLEDAGYETATALDNDPTFSARDNADCILVIWSQSSVNSQSVYEDALIGKKRRCLVQVETEENVKVGSEFDSGLVGIEYQGAILRAVGWAIDPSTIPQPMAAIGAYIRPSQPTPEEEEEIRAYRQQVNAEDERRTELAHDTLGIETGKLVHQIPTVMQVGVVEPVEIRIGVANKRKLADSLMGAGSIVVEDIQTVETMTVALTCKDGLKIERQSRSTQLVKGALLRKLVSDRRQFGRWVWRVTPTKPGVHKLSITITGDLTDSRGVATSAALPDRVFTVRVKVNYARATMAALKWGATGVGSMLLAGLIGAFTQEVWWPTVKAWLVGLGFLVVR